MTNASILFHRTRSWHRPLAKEQLLTKKEGKPGRKKDKNMREFGAGVASQWAEAGKSRMKGHRKRIDIQTNRHLKRTHPINHQREQTGSNYH